MAKFVLFFALLCLQVSRGEELTGTDGAEVGANLAIPFPDEDPAELEVPKSGEKSAEWTAEDDKWFEGTDGIPGEDSDEDYEGSDAEMGKLIQEIEKLVGEHLPGKGKYEWLQEIAKWFYADDDNDEEDDSDEEVEEGPAPFYSWIYRKNAGNARKSKGLLQPRFSSV